MSRVTNKQMISILDDLENRLNRHIPQYQREPEFNNNNNLFNINRSNMNMNNNIEYPLLNSQNNYDNISPSMEYKIRQIIKDEFNLLILPYQKEMHNGFNIMESKIEKNSNELKNIQSKNLNNFQNFLSGENDFNLNQPNALDNNQYVLRFEYDNKMNELTHQITTLNSFTKSLKDAFDNIGERKYNKGDDFSQKMNEIQNQFDAILGDMNQFQNNINNINQSLAEMKINNNKLKNELQNEIQTLKINSIGNSQNNSKNFNESILANLNKLKNEFDLFAKQFDMNFMNSLKTIVNQHVTIAEFNVVKNDIANKHNYCENKINNIEKQINI